MAHRRQIPESQWRAPFAAQGTLRKLRKIVLLASLWGSLEKLRELLIPFCCSCLAGCDEATNLAESLRGLTPVLKELDDSRELASGNLAWPQFENVLNSGITVGCGAVAMEVGDQGLILSMKAKSIRFRRPSQ